jgi:hypothetical protein
MGKKFGRVAVVAILLCSAGFSAARANDTDQQKLLQLMQITKVIMIPHSTVPANKFVADNDPNSLEVVFLNSAAEGPSHVSDDGQVIFLDPDAADDVQQALIMQALEIRIKRQSTGSAAK